MIEDDGRVLHISDGRGVRLLVLLLASPGREIHSLDLVAAVDRLAPGAAGGREGPARFEPQGDAGAAPDATGEGAHRKHEAVAFELGRAVAIGGRDRRSGAHAERARVNVTRAIRAAIRRIGGYDAALGRELGAAVRTGAFCVYEPDPRRPRSWRIDDGAPPG
jgi:hypothetical protein